MNTNHAASAETATALSVAAARASWRRLVGLDPPVIVPVITPLDSVLGENLTLDAAPRVGVA